MGFNNRNATPLDFLSSPTLPQSDSSEDHNVPTAVSPTTAKLQDWIADVRYRAMSSNEQVLTSDAYSYAHTTHLTLSIDPAFPEITFGDVAIGDLIIIDCVGCASISGTPTTNCAVYIAIEWDGATQTYLDGYVPVQFSGNFALHDAWTVVDAPLGTWSTGIIKLSVGAHADNGTTTLTMLGRVTLSAIHIRRS
jgi:hypothetical protein